MISGTTEIFSFNKPIKKECFLEDGMVLKHENKKLEEHKTFNVKIDNSENDLEAFIKVMKNKFKKYE